MKGQKKVMGKFLSLMVCAFMFVLCLFGGRTLRQDTSASSVTVSDNYVTVENVFNGDAFDQAQLFKLLSFVTGIDNFSFSNMDQLLQMSKETRSAYDINQVAVGEKKAGADVNVKFRNSWEEWSVTYLSQDKNGNVILTLLYDENGNETYFSSLTNSQTDGYQGFYGNNNPGNLYPSASYGTSYIRAVELNNGGDYLYKDGEEYLHRATQDENNTFAYYTMEKFKLTDYIVKPVDVAWQEKGESAVEYLNFDHYLSNENWSTEMPDELFARIGDTTANMARTAHNTDWKDDYLWLPSLTEVGYSDGVKGMWEMSTLQRNCHNNYNPSEDYFTRSAVKDSVSSIFRYHGNGYTTANVGVVGCARPAIHLNISKALLPSAGEVESIEVKSPLKDGDQFSAAQVNVYNVYSSGFKYQIHDGISFVDIQEGDVLAKNQVITVNVESFSASFKVLNSSVERDDYVASTSVGFKDDVDLYITEITAQSEIDALMQDLTEQPQANYSVRQLQVKNSIGVVEDKTVKVKVPVSAVPTGSKVYVIIGRNLIQKYASDGYYTLDGADNVVVFVESEQLPESPGTDEGDDSQQSGSGTVPAPKVDRTYTIVFGTLSVLVVVATLIFVIVYVIKNRKRKDN